MCGIMAYWARESILPLNMYSGLLYGVEKRGLDGIGIVVVGEGISVSKKWMGSFSRNSVEVLDFIHAHTKVGSILMVSCRATPETEEITTFDMLQPIENRGLVLIHNGGITDTMREEVPKQEYQYTTQIDSEIILAKYFQHGRCMKECMESISGSFAFVLLDKDKGKLFAVTSFNPLAHMYLRGYGYFLHSDNVCLSGVLEEFTGCIRDGVNVWESWYHHDLDGFSIVEVDLDSGFQFVQKYRPRFLHPVWDGMDEGHGVKVFVVASGGIDSGLTAFILSLLGYSVTMVHFSYGQKAEEAEWLCVQRQADRFHCSCVREKLTEFYLDIQDTSMLLDASVDIDSGGEKIKSTVAWVAGRNALFACMVMARAEAMIINEGLQKVYLSAGWAQLSEETGGYPDNSYKFNRSLAMLRNYGYITGDRMEWLPILQRITKTEEWLLGKALGFPFELTVSCDNPEVVDGKVVLCRACGSTKLSVLAADRAGVEDRRIFDGEREKESKKADVPLVVDVVERLMLSPMEKERLRKYIQH